MELSSFPIYLKRMSRDLIFFSPYLCNEDIFYDIYLGLPHCTTCLSVRNRCCNNAEGNENNISAFHRPASSYSFNILGINPLIELMVKWIEKCWLYIHLTFSDGVRAQAYLNALERDRESACCKAAVIQLIFCSVQQSEMTNCLWAREQKYNNRIGESGEFRFLRGSPSYTTQCTLSTNTSTIVMPPGFSQLLFNSTTEAAAAAADDMSFCLWSKMVVVAAYIETSL